MGMGHAFRIPKTSVCRWQVQRQYTFVRLPEIHFTASGFFLKIFTVCAFCLCFFLVFLFVFFFESTCYHDYEKQEKTTLKITTIYEPVEQSHYCVEVFTDYHVKRALSVCVI